MLVKIIATSPSVPGDAQLVIMLREMSELVEKLDFSLINNEQCYLQSDKLWSPAPHWFAIQGGYPLSNGSGFHIGHDIVDPLLTSNSQIQIHVKLATGETRATTLKIYRDELLPSSARGESCEYGSSSKLPLSTRDINIPFGSELPSNIVITEPSSVPEPVILTPDLEPKAKLTEQGKTKTKFSLIVGIILLLLLILAAGFFWFNKSAALSSDPVQAPVDTTTAQRLGKAVVSQDTTQVNTDSATVQPSEKTGSASINKDRTQANADSTTVQSSEKTGSAVEESSRSCIIANLESKGELEFVQSCFNLKLSTDDLLQIIEAAKASGKCGVAQRLYANRAQSGDTKIALAYAHEYDPKYHQPNSCFKDADKDTAAYWYDTVLQSAPDNVEAKQRYEELSK